MVWKVTSLKRLKLEIGKESKLDMETTKITTRGPISEWPSHAENWYGDEVRYEDYEGFQSLRGMARGFGRNIETF